MAGDRKERRLISRLRDRDESAFDQLVRQYGDRVYNLTFRLLANTAEAEDVAQEVFITVFKSIETFREDAKLSTWLLKIAANHAKNRIKYLSIRAQPHPGADAAQLESDKDGFFRVSPSTPEDCANKSQLGDSLNRALARLDDNARLLIVLRDIEELPYDEVAEITGQPVGTVKSGLHRARIRLKDILERLTSKGFNR